MLQVVEPPQNEYERSRDRQVAANNKKMQALGLKVLASVFNKSVPPSESRQNKGNKKTNSNNSESSKYHLEDDDQGCTSDDVTELSDGAPMALEIKVLPLPSMLCLLNHIMSFECFQTVVYYTHLLSKSSCLCHASYFIYALAYRCT
jgi:hypothetical protein